MTLDQLERAFRVYFDEINRCSSNKCYWALLHLLVILPDICAALESHDGEADDGRYRKWCKRYFPSDRRFKAGDRYEMRCVLLHKGRTLTDRGQYRSFSLLPPDGNDDLHLRQTDFGPRMGLNLTIVVSKLAEETLGAMHRWFEDVVSDGQRLENVRRHVPLLVRVGEKVIPGASGIEFRVTTTSSTGGL